MITNITAAIFFAFFFVEILRWHKKSELFNRKPFNCIPCLSAWSAMVLYFLPTSVSDFILVMFGAGTCGAIFIQLMNKIYRL